MDFRDGEGAAMDVSESNTDWSASGPVGVVLSFCHLVGEEERVFLLNWTIPALGFGGFRQGGAHGGGL